MEIMHKDKVELPALPGSATAKQKLAWEVAGRIIEQMNRNDPKGMDKAYICVKHHGGQEKPFLLYVSENAGDKWWFKSGSKVVEAVNQALSKVSCIDSVAIEATFHETIGVFKP